MTYDELLAVVDASPRVAVYLTIDGCGPCKAVRPWAEALFDDPSWRWLPIDTAASPDVAGQLLVFSHPTLILFADGREAHRFSRVVPRQAVEQGKADVERRT
jgi:thioredoxin-like negative regulator of GroEL